MPTPINLLLIAGAIFGGFAIVASLLTYRNRDTT